MAKVQVTGGVLEVEAILGASPPDTGLPAPPPIAGQLPSSDLHPWVPGHLPAPPPTFPPLTPSHPIQPAPPGTPPGAIWPPVGSPSHPIAGTPPAPDQGLPPPVPGAPAHPIAPAPPVESKTYWLVCGIPGVGWRYVSIDPSLVAGQPLPPAPAPKK
jgi:hypothetical protein